MSHNLCITAITDLSCDFESDECKWSPVPIQNRFRWEYGLLDHNKFPDVDHTSACEFNQIIFCYECLLLMSLLSILIFTIFYD